MPGLFSRIKTALWPNKFLNEDLNAEFDNFIQNATPQKVDDYSSTVSQMRKTTSPGSLGAESLPSTLAGEIERLRYMIKSITGGAQWYSSSRDLNPFLVSDIAFVINFESKDNTAQSVIYDMAKRGCILNPMSKSSNYGNIQSNCFTSSAAKFGSFGYDVSPANTNDNIIAYPGRYNSISQGGVCLWFKKVGFDEGIAYNPNLGIEIYINSSGYLVGRIRKATAASGSVKDYATVTGTDLLALTNTMTHVCFNWVANAVNGASTDSAYLYVNNSSTGTPISSSSIVINSSPDSVWFFGAKRNDPTWSKYSSMNVAPDSDGWSVTTSGAPTVSLSNGVLRLVSTNCNADYQFYYIASSSDINLSTFNFEIKFKLGSSHEVCAGSATVDSTAFVTLGDDSTSGGANRAIKACFAGQMINFYDKDASATARLSVPHNCYNWTVMRITTTGSTDLTANVYLNGEFVGSFSVTQAAGLANNIVKFGLNSNTTTQTAGDLSVEYVAYANAAAIAPVVEDTVGNFDDICVTRIPASSTFLAAIQTSSIESYVRYKFYRGPSYPRDKHILSSSGVVNTLTKQESIYYPATMDTAPLISMFGTFTNATSQVFAALCNSFLAEGSGLTFTYTSNLNYLLSNQANQKVGLTAFILGRAIPDRGVTTDTLSEAYYVTSNLGGGTVTCKHGRLVVTK